MEDELIVLGVIPARADSSRFPLKVIAKIHDKPMVQYVWETAKASGVFGQILVATDDDRVSSTVEQFGARAVLTPKELPSGTDRVALVARDYLGDIIVNLQADEPLLPAAAVQQLVKTLIANPQAQMATLAVKKVSTSEFQDPNVVKVVLDFEGSALYFSRSPLASRNDGQFLKHIGIYAFRREALFNFCKLPPSALELTERLEQLRALENGMRIAVAVIENDTIAVDTPGDIQRVERTINDRFLTVEERLE